MGAGFGRLLQGTEENSNDNGCPSKTGLGDLPESCLALVLSFLEPLEICRLACLSTAFRRASSADIVWESKLPHNYQILTDKALSSFTDRDDDGDSRTSAEALSTEVIMIMTTTTSSINNKSKKEIFARLCCPNRFDNNTKEFWLQKKGGKTCVAISWKGLKITGIADRRYWNHISTHESRFKSIAYLRQIWWLEVEGNIEFEFPAGNYSVFFRLKLGRISNRGRSRRDVYNDPEEEVHGWNMKPVEFKLSLSLPKGGQQIVKSEYYLNKVGIGKWMEYHVGDFMVEEEKEKDSLFTTKLKFSMTQIDCTHSKGGLCLDSVFIYPQ